MEAIGGALSNRLFTLGEAELKLLRKAERREADQQPARRVEPAS